MGDAAIKLGELYEGSGQKKGVSYFRVKMRFRILTVLF